MNAPPRLTDDPSAPASLRADLRTAAETDARAFDPEAGLASLRAKIGVPPPPPAGSLGPTFWGVAGVGSAVVLGALLAGGYAWLDEPEPAPHAATVVPIEAAPEPVEQTQAPAVEPEPEIVAPPAAPERVERSVDPDARLRAEIAHLARVRSLYARDPAAALRLAEEGHRRFPRGMYREEREALAVLSLARLGRDAQPRARAFLARHPRGPFSEEIGRIARP